MPSRGSSDINPRRSQVAIDALAVYVNKDNPVQGLTMAQVDAIFSKSRRWGHHENIQVWKQAGLLDGLGDSPISTYGRNSASGTYGFFKEHALKNGDFQGRSQRTAWVGLCSSKRE